MNTGLWDLASRFGPESRPGMTELNSGRTPPAARTKPRLDRVPDIDREIDAVEPCDLLDPGGRCHVDLGHVVADDVDPDKDEPVLPEARTDRGADLALPRGQPGLLRAAADMQVGPRLAVGRHAVDRPHRLALDEDDALVALPHLGEV